VIKALMIDVDGVIVHPAYAGGWAERLEADLGLPVAELQREFFAPHWNDIALGRADLHDCLGPVLARIAPKLSSQDLADYWFAHDARLDTVLLKDLAALRAGGMQLHLATIQEHHRARYLWETLEFRDQFDAIHYAAALGCAKPDPAFFHAIEDRTGFGPAELLLIDDRSNNIEGAITCGWGAQIWDGTRRLSEVLSEAGVAWRR
jgi:putative hydrolase of the HAD superfamily